MNRLKKILVILIAIGFSANAGAQILDRLGKKLEQKAADRLERKIDKTMDKGLDKTEEEIDKTVTKKPDNGTNSEDNNSSNDSNSDYDANSEPSSGGGMLANMFKPVDIKDEYSFDLSLTYLITTISEKETTEMDYDFAMSEKNNGDLMMTIKDMRVNGKSEMSEEQGAMNVIFDAENKAMISVMKEQKMYMPISMDLGAAVEEQNEDQNFTMTKTGKTKSILGYSCEEYEVTTDETYGTIWVSTDSRLNNINPYTTILNSSKKNNKSKATQTMMEFDGAMMEMNMTFKEAKKKSDPKTMSYVVTDVKEVSITEDFKGLSNPMQMQMGR